MRALSPWLLAALLAPSPVLAGEESDDARSRVIVVENVRFDYAQVLNVEPVYQTLRARRMEERCEPPVAPERGERAPAPAHPDEGRLARMVDTVKGWFGSTGESEPAVPPPPPPPASVPERRNCHLVEVGREFRRPIAYDVDYVYKGTKYRSRLPEDPGNRLRIRVTVAPYVPGAVIVPPR